ncbi:hypothetical protein BDF14DRAFT_1857713 [Spinellus fusiger]|nr:hypothetical protein BDF14DRAFT_1857713 [Spinellus fusiger]
MTRYTKLERKKHDPSAGSGFEVNPLVPTKKTPNTQQHKGQKRERNDRAALEVEKRRKRRDMRKENGTVCFGCRKPGHSVSHCPEAKQGAQGICYNCGTTEHSLKQCKKPRKGSKLSHKRKRYSPADELPFAKCFVCEGQGHLSSQCLYPNGGGCRFCSKVDHLARDCGVTKEEAGTTLVGKIDLEQGADDDDYHIFVNEKQKAVEENKEEKKIKKEIKTVLKTSRKVVQF